MNFRKLTGGAALALCFAISPAAAQDGAHNHPATEAAVQSNADEIGALISREAAQDAAVADAAAKADAALVKNTAQDARLDDLANSISAVTQQINALTDETAALRQSIGDLDARVTALEAGGGGDPDPTPIPPVISIDVAPQSAAEGASYTFTLTRTGDLSGASSVAYQAFGEADAADFSGGVIASGVVSFAPDDAFASLTIATVDDSDIETDEDFGVALSNPVGADLGVSAASAVILNNDQSPIPPPAKKTVVILGASSAAGKNIWKLFPGTTVADEPAYAALYAWPSLYEKSLGDVTVRNLALSGYSATKAATAGASDTHSLAYALATYPVIDELIVSFPALRCAEGETVAGVTGSLKSIYDTAKAAGAKRVRIATSQPSANSTDPGCGAGQTAQGERVALTASILSTFGADAVDFFSPLSVGRTLTGLADPALLNSVDLIHPNVEGHAALAKAAEGGTVTPPPPPPPVTGSVWPDGADGKPILQLVLGHHKDWQGEAPYKNHRHLNPGCGSTAKIVNGECDPTTGWIYLNPKEVITLGKGRALQNPDGVNIDPGKWILTATTKPGSCSTIEGAGFKDDGSSGQSVRRARVLDATTTDAALVSINGNSCGGWIRVDFWGNEKDEGDPNGFRDAFVGEAAKYFLTRFLDWFTTSGSKVTDAEEWLDDGDYTVFTGTNGLTSTPSANAHLRKVGYQFGWMFKLVNAADTAAWVNTPPALGMGSIKDTLYICKNATLIPAIMANWSVIDPSMHQEAYEWGVKLAASAVNNNYPDNKVLVVEVGNEWWNNGNSSFACTNDVAEGVGAALTNTGPGPQNAFIGAGHIASVHVAEIKRAFAEVKPKQELAFALGMQTMAFSTFPSNFHNMAITQFAAETPENLIDLYAATTGYYGGGFAWNKNRSPGAGNPWGATNEDEFNTAFIAADQAGTLNDDLRAYFLGPINANPNVAKLVDLHQKWINWAHGRGLAGVIQYEGGNADAANTLPADTAKGRPYDGLAFMYPGLNAAHKNWVSSPQAFDVQDAMIFDLSKLKSVNPAKTSGWRPQSMPISNYQIVGKGNNGSPWQEKDPEELGLCPPSGMAGAWCKYARQ